MRDSRRLCERIADYQRALRRLNEALHAGQNNLVVDAIVQRFEFTFELSWKVLKLWLEFKEIIVRTPQEVLREALSAGLIENGNGWTQMQKERNKTRHTYDENMVVKVVEFVRAEGIILFQSLASRLEILAKEGR